MAIPSHNASWQPNLCAYERSIQYVLKLSEILLWILGHDKIRVMTFGIDPVAGLQTQIGGQDRRDIRHDLLLCHPEVGGLRPIHVDVKLGSVHALIETNICYPIDGSKQLLDVNGRLIQLPQIGSSDLDIDRRRETKVQYVTDQAARLKAELDAGKLLLQVRPDEIDVLPCASLMRAGQIYHDDRGVCPSVR